ncbi:uncharacterized protein YndB with AHSA1/START domain [Natronospira proteinivora]|uniref:Uncharacterized protein YndB with AHSA1/START domain n=1 Tax=Natronospira proteinivora TaxID=1807133 RepID=A0ABT1G959_9GAMM|nr:SRPBCC family protein [Natronospira proteinivora]MCP1727572.1 uncharacterized protein YndB with AHSA1/START domain [Natronospira proteinivora]
MEISIETTVNAPIERVWQAWTTPEEIKCWNFASDDWCCPDATLDLKVGGKFNYRMESKDGSMGFDFEGEFTAIDSPYRIEFTLGDERVVKVSFHEIGDNVQVVETFEAEDEMSAEQQRDGWQSILLNFKKHVEGDSA